MNHWFSWLITSIKVMVVLQLNSRVVDLIETYLQIKYHVFCGNKPAMLESYRRLIIEEMITSL